MSTLSKKAITSPPPDDGAPSRARPPAGSLWPHEHGAYAELALPLLTALCVAPATASALGLAVCAVSGFLVHEPLLVLLGRRGTRAKRELRAEASRRLALLVALALIGALVGLRDARAETLVACGVVAALVVGALVLVRSNREKTLAGELFVAMTLTTAAAPIVLARAAWGTALVIVGVWTAIFVLGTLAVHGVLARAKAGSSTLLLASSLLALALAVGAVVLIRSGELWAAALLPPVAATLGVVLLRATPKHLRRIGWAMVAADLVAFAALVAGTRGL